MWSPRSCFYNVPVQDNNSLSRAVYTCSHVMMYSLDWLSDSAKDKYFQKCLQYQVMTRVPSDFCAPACRTNRLKSSFVVSVMWLLNATVWMNWDHVCVWFVTEVFLVWRYESGMCWGFLMLCCVVPYRAALSKTFTLLLHRVILGILTALLLLDQNQNIIVLIAIFCYKGQQGI